MIQTATLSRTAPLPPRAPSARPSGEAGDFAGALAEVSEESDVPVPAADDTRQDDAATGNALPLPVIAPDSAFIWQPIVATPAPSPLVSAPASPPGSRIVDASGLQPVSVQRPTFAQSQPQSVTPAPIEPQPFQPSAPTQAADTPAMQLAAAIMAAMPPVKSAAHPLADTPTVDAPRWTTPDTAPVAVALAIAQPDAAQPKPGTVASAAMVFGAAIQAATKKRDEPDTPAPSDAPLAPVGAAATQEISVADVQQAPLDMRQERWPHAMIERIEMLRDAADAVDTRIRLVPDALGAIDVSVKTDGDTVHVHFNAEQAATRTLLADAQPRLAELAEARGLKLAQGSLGDGGAQQQRAPATPQIPNRPASASAVIADTATDDIRIA